MTVQALNFAPKAIPFLEQLADSTDLHRPDLKEDTDELRHFADALDVGETFLLPDGGILMDRDRRFPDLPAAALRPPFEITVLEFPCSAQAAHTLHPKSKHRDPTKYVAVAHELTDPDTNEPLGVGIRTAIYDRTAAAWIPVLLSIVVPYDSPPGVRGRPLLAVTTYAPGIIEMLGFEDLDRDALGELGQRYLTDAYNAYLDLCATLACKNVHAQRHQQPEKLQKARAKQGKRPLRDFHVLTVDGNPSNGGGAIGMDSGDRTGPRAHMRRGHVRRLGPDRLTWVSPCMVNAGASEFVGKAYRVKP